MSKLPDLEAWAIFAKVADLGSFSRAAEELGLSKPTVSKAITRLENRLRVPLLQRTSRQMQLTDNGTKALERARRILHDGVSAEAEIATQAEAPCGLVRIAAPMSFGIQTLAPLLPDFLATYPDVQIDLRLNDAQEDVISQGFDLAIRIAALQDSSLRARRLCAVPRPIIAAPAYLERFGTPHHPRDLIKHQAIFYSNALQPDFWRLRHDELGEWEGRTPGRLSANNADVIMPALHAGLGIAIQPIFSVWESLQSGSLVEILKGWSLEPISLYLVTPPSALQPSSVRVFRQYIIDNLHAPAWCIEH